MHLAGYLRYVWWITKYNANTCYYSARIPFKITQGFLYAGGEFEGFQWFPREPLSEMALIRLAMLRRFHELFSVIQPFLNNHLKH